MKFKRKMRHLPDVLESEKESEADISICNGLTLRSRRYSLAPSVRGSVVMIVVTQTVAAS